MPIFKLHHWRRTIPPLADCFRIKARVPVAVGLAAVSYTHLDVYKRQLQERVQRLRQVLFQKVQGIDQTRHQLVDELPSLSSSSSNTTV